MSGGIGIVQPRIPRNALVSSFSGAATTSDIQAETYPRFAISGQAAPTAGALYGIRIRLVPGSYTTVSFFVGTQGVSLTNTYFALYPVGASGASVARLSVSADVSTPVAAFTANQLGTATLNTTITEEADYFLAFLVGGAGTMIQFAGTQPFNGPAVYFDPPLVCNHSSGSLTAAPSSLTITTPTNGRYPWLRYS